MKKWIQELNRHTFGKGLYSQSYQDALIKIIFENLGTVNPRPYCVEFGFDAPDFKQGVGANVARLVLEEKWDCLLLDGGFENPAINLHQHFLTSANIVEIFQAYGVPQEPEYISIDVDSTDLWLFRALVKTYRAMVYSVEYNANFPLDKAITFPDDPAERWQGDRGMGASLKALTLVAEENGYSLLWVVSGMDAFFVRNDLIDDGTDRLVPPYATWAACTNFSKQVPLKDPERARIFLDYGVFARTGGDVEASRRAAYPVCQRYLVGNGDLTRQVRRVGRLWSRLQGRLGRAGVLPEG